MVSTIEDSRASSKILKEINNTFIALILKKEKPDRMEYFWPIFLCNIVYKIPVKAVEN